MSTNTRPPNHPIVPKPRFGKLAIASAIVTGTITTGYAAAAFTDYEPDAPERDEVPASVRSSPGGYRSFHTWHSGYHGGK
jgi:hypothetical protein